MTISTLMSLIAAVCFQSGTTREQKEDCLEAKVNCAIVKSGEVRKDVNVCFQEKK